MQGFQVILFLFFSLLQPKGWNKKPLLTICCSTVRLTQLANKKLKFLPDLLMLKKTDSDKTEWSLRNQSEHILSLSPKWFLREPAPHLIISTNVLRHLLRVDAVLSTNHAAAKFVSLFLHGSPKGATNVLLSFHYQDKLSHPAFPLKC